MRGKLRRPRRWSLVAGTKTEQSHGNGDLEEYFYRPSGGTCTRRSDADDRCAVRPSGRLRYRLDPHHPDLGSGNAQGCIVRGCLHDDYEQWQDTGSGKLRVERRQRAMPNSHHDHGRQRDEDAARGGRPRNQAGRCRSCSWHDGGKLTVCFSCLRRSIGAMA